MPVYKPSELRNFLNLIGASPKKSLSQNFLIDGNIIKKIVTTAKVMPGDVVLEIGSGPGALTEELLNAGAIVVAVERDHVLAKGLERLQTVDGRLNVFCEDILQFPFHEILPKFLKDGQKVKIIANLPYHVTTPILTHFIDKNDLFSSFIVMVQEEVGRRFTAKPGSKEYGSITVFLNFYSSPNYGFSVSRHCFYPPPKVESAIVILDLKTPPPISNVINFFKLTRQAFEHRRKMLRASLKELYPSERVTNALCALNLNPLARPEDLSLNEFLSLYKFLEA